MSEKVMPDQIALVQIGAFVPFPSDLVDEWMPKLKDTEWRLLCVIVRQTIGWQSGKSKGRKRRDWLSQHQLIARTGRGSAALSAAIEGLIKKNLIECCNAQGQPLTTPKQRRRHRGRVYFALAPNRFTAANLETVTPSLGASGIFSGQVSPTRIYQGWSRVGHIAQQLDYQQKNETAKSEVQKANRTKETEEQKKNL